MEWISVNDRLPEKGQVCLVFAYDICGDLFGLIEAEPCVYKVSFGAISYSSVCDTDYYEVYVSGITHWMPLPSPPNSKNK